MNLKRLSAGALMALAAVSASANDVNTNPSILGSTGWFAAIHTDNSPFTDTFSFVGASGPLLASASVITISLGAGSNIDFASATLNGNAFTLSPTGIVEFGSLTSTALTGPLVLVVKGTTDAANGVFASYSGTVNVTTVPEPETYALMLAGLAGIGFLARRRQAT